MPKRRQNRKNKKQAKSLADFHASSSPPTSAASSSQSASQINPASSKVPALTSISHSPSSLAQPQKPSVQNKSESSTSPSAQQFPTLVSTGNPVIHTPPHQCSSNDVSPKQLLSGSSNVSSPTLSNANLNELTTEISQIAPPVSQPSHIQSSSSRHVPSSTPKSPENTKSAVQVTNLGHASVNMVRPMARPSVGVVGSRVKLDANFFQMTIPEKLSIKQYAVAIKQWRHVEELDFNKRKRGLQFPEEGKAWYDFSHIEPISFNRNVIKAVLDGRNFGCLIAYDGRSIAYAPREIDLENICTAIELDVCRDGTPATRKDFKNDHTVTTKVQVFFTFSKKLEYGLIGSSSPEGITASEYMAAVDNVLAHSPRLRFVQIGRSFYSSHNAHFLIDPRKRSGPRRDPLRVSAWSGFYQSARLSSNGVLLNLDQSFTAFWNHGSNDLEMLIRDVNGGKVVGAKDHDDKREITKKLKMVKIRAKHNNISYRFHGFSEESAYNMTFVDSGGERTSVSDYLFNSYGIQLKNGHWPCVRTHATKKIYLPIEMLTVQESQRFNGHLTAEETSEMVKYASCKPYKKRQETVNIKAALNHNEDPLVKEFGFNLADHLVQVSARSLSAPQMLFSGKSPVPVSNGQWRPSVRVNGNWRSLQFNRAVRTQHWAIIFDWRVQQADIQNFMNEIRNALNKVGMSPSPPSTYIMKRPHQEHPTNLSCMLKNVVRARNGRLQTVVIVKNDRNSKSYAEVKKMGDIELGVPTQVCVLNEIRGNRMLDKYCYNVVLKVNLKLGGVNCVPDSTGIKGSLDLTRTPHMVLGADVSHPTPGAKTPSVAALVGSQDTNYGQFSAAIRTQDGRKEMIEDIGGMFRELYGHWKRKSGYRTDLETVVMFRDGVSEGQFQIVMETEVEALRAACISLGLRLKLTYIIVTKRHHARFFGSSGQTDKSGNILAGTVIDEGVTSREYYDFYLNSHAGIQGTSKPSKYTVLVDENQFGADKLQSFAFKLAHSFARCNRSVSMVSSAYYAHLLAFRAKVYLGEDDSDQGTVCSTGTDSNIVPTPRIADGLKDRLFFV